MQPNNPGFFKKGRFIVKETNELYVGEPASIELGSEVKYYDEQGRELQPAGIKEPKELTEAELFYNGSWRKQ